MKKVFFLMVMFVFGSVAMASLLPANTTYDGPNSGTLVFDEDYGTDIGKDGIGSWNKDTSTFFIDTDSIAITTKGTAALLPLPFDVGESSCVIDIGIKGWSADSSYSDLRFTLLMATWGAKQSVKLSPSNDGTLVPVSGSGTAPNPQDTANVIRLTSGVRGSFYAYSGIDESEVTINTYGWGATSDLLVVHNVSPNAGATVDISWIKIYQNVEDRSAPLAVPEPATISLLIAGGCMSLLRRKH